MEMILETLGKIGFEWKLALFNLINFLLLFWILSKFLFEPMLKVINERHEKVTESVDNIKKAQSELAMAEQNAGKIIDKAKGTSNEIIAKAHDEAGDIAVDMKVKAKNEIEMLVNQAKKNIEIDKQAMKEELRAGVVELIVDTTEKVLGDKIDAKKDKKMIQDAVSEVK